MKFFALSLMVLIFTMNTGADEKVVEKLIQEKVSVESTLCDPKVTGKVFKGKFYNSKIKIDTGDFNSSKATSAVIDGKARILWQTTTNRDMTTLLACVKDGFKLNSEENIKNFEAALDEIFVVSRPDKDKGIIKNKDKIIFVRGKFFKKLKGFLVTIDKDGSIKEIQYRLDIEQ